MTVVSNTSPLIERTALMAYFEAVVPRIYRYPALDAGDFRQAVEAVVSQT